MSYPLISFRAEHYDQVADQVYPLWRVLSVIPLILYVHGYSASSSHLVQLEYCLGSLKGEWCTMEDILCENGLLSGLTMLIRPTTIVNSMIALLDDPLL